jgi:type 1 glutamine amidotransferase
MKNFILAMLCMAFSLQANATPPRFRAIALYENGGHHIAYSKAARVWLDKLAADSNFAIDYIQNTDQIDAAFLSHYQLFIQLDYAPYNWKPAAVKAFEDYIDKGRGGWIGFHHATLLGEFDGFPMWDWFYHFMGQIRFKDYIPDFADGIVHVEDKQHPVMKGVPDSFRIKSEEWYTYDQSPRPHVQVIAHVNESSYEPASAKKMGDHPVIWSNPAVKARNIYIFMGHSPELFNDDVYKTIFTNAIFWAAAAKPVIYVNQVGYELQGPKTAVVASEKPLPANTRAFIGDSSFNISGPVQIKEWDAYKYYYQVDFTHFNHAGSYTLTLNGTTSPAFVIADHALATLTIPSILHYYHQQRANTPEELAADKQLLLYGSDQRVDMHGGWCDASGDVSKYFSHLAYANFMSPQQTPLVTWSLIGAAEKQTQLKDSLMAEALWGADYMMRALSDDGYFRMIVFSYFKKDPAARRVVGLEANSVTTNAYQCAFREGGGMAIAALARISQWKKNGDFTAAQYLAAARRAYAHLLINNTRYDDNGRENIIDDYCALMAATELWIATNETTYRDDARRRAAKLEHRMSRQGYFIADDSIRPFWHASDAGLPVVALVRYLDKEKDATQRNAALHTIKQALDYNIRITNETPNPFGYARQSFLYKGAVKNGFFIPHENETGWWWQGENARLASLATAALLAGKLLGDTRAVNFATQQLNWILGCNPYSMCFMYQFGQQNVPYMHSNYGHGSEKGGISNGITGGASQPDGSGIDFKLEDNGNEWRWTEQWIPHAAWFLQALNAM